MVMTTEERVDLARLAEAATPGPWQYVEQDGYQWITELDGGGNWQSNVAEIEAMDDRDGAFIAAARTAVPALLAENAALRVVGAKFTGPLAAMHFNGRRWVCVFCKEEGSHTADCPVTEIRALLKEGA